MTTNQFTIDTGSTIYVGSFLITQSAVQVNLPISVIIDSTGAEKGIATNGIYVIPSGGTITSILNAVTITGSTTIASMPAVTGSVSIISSPAITGSVTVISTPVVTGSVSLVVAPSFSSATATATTAGTGIVIPSTASNSIYITSLVISNGLTGGTIYLGYNTGATAPTTTAIYIPTLYFAANGGMVYPIPQQTPIKLPASTNFVFTVASTGTISILATYYVAP